MQRFERVKEILDTLINGETIGAHRAFWRGLTLEQFIAKKVFGFPLVEVGTSATSNLILALRGQPPFGADTGEQSATFRRMPAGRPAATDEQISYIANWIDAGCPDDDEVPVRSFAAEAVQPVDHNAYWREFDNWAMFNAPPDVEDAIGVFFPLVGEWVRFARNPANESAWTNAIGRPASRAALQLLSGRQVATVSKYYGDPIDLDSLFDSYRRFGAGTLPPDPLRPQDPNHNMNGREMWFYWGAFADACLRLQIDLAFWHTELRAMLIGLLHDGVFRGRFTVTGYNADQPGSDQMVSDARGLAETALRPELRRRFLESGLMASP